MKITVITAVYNAKDTIAHAIESSLEQTYHDVELIIIDGGSTDGTKEILENYTSQVSVFISEPDNGIYDALNKGIQYATGDIVGFLHADDLYYNKNVLDQVAKAFLAPEVDFVYGDLAYVHKMDPEKVIRYWKAGTYSRSKLKRGWMPPHPTVYLRRSIYGMVGKFDVSLRISADYDLMLRVLGHQNVCCAYIPETLVKMRVGGISNKSLRNVLLKTKEDYVSLRKNDVGGSWGVICKNFRKLLQFIQR